MTDNESKPGAKKVDESWKERARQEKETLEGGRAASGGQGSSQGAEKGPQAGEERTERGGLPPVTFLGLLAGIAAQASVYMGFVENPLTGQKEEDIEAAKHIIDTIAMLKEKTQGNLTDTESMYIDDLLYGLRMEYVKKRK